MKRLLTALAILFTLNFTAQCNEEETKMLILGDSWAFFSWVDYSYTENLERFGFTDIDTHSNLNFSVNGAWASSYFQDADRMEALEEYIQDHPELEVVHLSLGGNDMLGQWNNTMGVVQVDLLIDEVMQNLKDGIETIWSFNPDLHIHLAGYDYPNFSETVGTAPVLLQSIHPFYDLWDGMGQPTAFEINNTLLRTTEAFIDSSAVWDNVSFVNQLGLMQWEKGQLDSLTVAPFGTYPPFSVPQPNGLLNYPTPLDALQVGNQDSFHLDNYSFEQFIKRQFINFYWEFFRDADHSLTRDTPSNNGWISDNDYSTAKLRLGKKDGDQVKTILSFDTSELDDQTEVTKATIFLQRSHLTGFNLDNKDLNLDIKSGHFGALDELQSDDFDAEADASEVSCHYGSMAADDYYYRIDIGDALLPFINTEGTTQFRLSYNINISNRYYEFTIDPDKIILDINQGDLVLGVESYEKNEINVYPNPTNDKIFITSASSIDEISLYDIYGKLVLSNYNSNQLDMSKLSSGIYILRVSSEDEIWEEKVIKE